MRALPFTAAKVLLPLVLLLTLSQPAISQTFKRQLAERNKAEEPSDAWAIIMLGSDRIGYSRTRSNSFSEGRFKLIRSIEESKMTIKRFGRTIEMTSKMVTVEEPNGSLRSFEINTTSPPAQPTNIKATIENNKLTRVSTVNGKEKSQVLSWDRSAKSPAWQDRSLRLEPIIPGEKRSLRLFDPVYNKISDNQIVAERPEQIETYGGEKQTLLRVVITQSINPQMPTTAWVDATGNVYRSEAELLGTKLIKIRVPAEVALEALTGSELDIAVNTMTRLEKPIKTGYRSKKVVYTITIPGQDAAKAIPATDYQLVKSNDDQSAEVTITAPLPPDATRHVRADKELLKATPFLQVNDLRVQDHARHAAAGQSNPWKIAQNMEKYVRKEIHSKNFSTRMGSAAEVAKSLEGDCTEHAVLLAAMLRAKRIASKVAIGVVYVDSQAAFGGHMWTEAFIGGRWIPLDATLGKGGIGAVHIKLSEYDFADGDPVPATCFLPLFNVVGNMKIDVVSAE